MKKIPAGAHRYEATALARTEKAGKAFLSVEMYHKDGNFLNKLYSQSVSGDRWQQIRFNFDSVSDTHSLHLYCLSGETGAVYFKNIQLTYKGPSAKKSELSLQAKVLPVDWNSHWNQGRKEFTSLLDAPVPLSFHFKGNRRNLKNPELVIDLPEALKISEAFCMHPNYHYLETWKTETIYSNGKQYIRHHFKNPRTFQILQNSYGWQRIMVLMIVPRSQDQKEASFPVYWKLQDDMHSGMQNSFIFHLKKIPAGNLRPKNFYIYRWGQEDFHITDRNLLEKCAALLESCRMDATYRYGEGFPLGIKLTDFFSGRNWRMIMTHPDYVNPKFIQSGPVEELGNRIEYRITSSGPDRHKLCPDYFTDDPDFVRSFQKFFRKRNSMNNIQKGDIVMLDFEPWETLNWCFCERSRKKFAARFKLDHVPEISEIKKNFIAEWSQFRCENTADIIRICRETLNRYFPGTYLADYDYVVDFNRKNYKTSFYSVAKNPLLNEKYFDYHMASYYHYIDRQAFDMIRLNARTLQKKYIPICAIDGLGYLTRSEIMSPPQVRQMVLAAAANGCHSFGIYPGIHLDGTMYLAFHKAVNEIAVLEKYFACGKQDAKDIRVKARPYRIQTISIGETTRNLYFPNWKNHLAVSAIPYGQERLVSVFNYHPDTTMFTDVKAELPAGSYEVLSPVENKIIRNAEGQAVWSAKDLKKGILMKISPRDVQFILIRPAGKNSAGQNQLIDNQNRLDKEFLMFRNSYGSNNQFKPLKSGSSSMQLVDQNHDGSPEIELSNQTCRLYVDYQKGGILRGLTCNGKKFPVNCFEDRFWLPMTARGNTENNAMKIVKNSIENGCIRLVLSQKLNTPPLIIEKEFIMTEAVPNSWKIEYRLQNHSSAKTTFSWWNRNLLDHPVAPVFLNERQGKMLPIPEKIGDPVYSLKKNAAGFTAKNIKGRLSGTSSEIRWKGLTMTLKVNSDDFQNYYYWISPNVNTQEWMFTPVTLKPGKKWMYQLKCSISD